MTLVACPVCGRPVEVEVTAASGEMQLGQMTVEDCIAETEGDE